MTNSEHIPNGQVSEERLTDQQIADLLTQASEVRDIRFRPFRHFFVMALSELQEVRTRRSSAGVKVKALEWTEEVSGTWWTADAYRIEVFDGGGFAARVSHPQSRSFRTLAHGVTFDQAKAAAQADFNTRILSALSSPSHIGEDDEPVAMMCGPWGEEGSIVWLEGCERLEQGDYLYLRPSPSVPQLERDIGPFVREPGSHPTVAVPALTPSPTLEPTDAEVERAYRAFLREVREQDREWTDETDEGETSLIAPNGDGFAVFFPMRAALIASRQSISGNQDGGKP